MIDRIDIKNEYLSIKNHLDCFWDTINKRTNKGYTPYNLRSCAYMDDFNKQKIVYSEIVQTPQFYLDKDNKFMVDATAYIMVGNKIEYLIDWLNSKTMGWAFKRWYTVNLGDKGFRYQKQFIQKLPIPLPKNDKTNFSESDIHQILSLTEEEINFIQNTLQ